MTTPRSPDTAQAAERAARVAWRHGQVALRQGETDTALRWLDRACRLAPRDPTLRLGLATAWLGRDPARAADLFVALSAQHDVRDVWLGLAAARARSGDATGAMAALAVALSRHAAPQDRGWLPLADAIAPAGWCALTGETTLRLGPAHLPPPEVLLDDRPVPWPAQAALPAAVARARWLQVRRNGQDVVGSPVDLRAIHRLEGAIGWDGKALTGWAWHPADPMREPVLGIRPARGKPRTINATEQATEAPAGLLARPRRIHLALRAADGPFHVRGPDGQDLPGSPIDPGAECVAHPARRPPIRVPQVRATDIVIPVYRDAAATLACLESVLAARPRGTRVIVIDDATPELGLAAALDRLAARRRILLVRHPRNRGFPAAANAGLAKARAAGHDALLLNADTLVAPGFLSRLRTVAYAAPDIGTAGPLSNNATILSYPDPAGSNAMPDRAGTARLAALAWTENGAEPVDIPTGVGSCLYVRHDCLKATGLFRATIFGRGYGEENDFCMRAAAAGWRHVAAPGVFVAHAGEKSFGSLAAGLRARNEVTLTRLHPTYPARVAAHLAADPLFAARRRLDMARFHASQPEAAPAALLITHARGGGVARTVARRCDALRAEGAWPLVLAPALGAAVQVEGFPNLRFALPEELPALLAFLRATQPARAEIHHTLGHHPLLLELPHALGVPYDVHVHDYHWLCPRLVLSGQEGRYCGEPDLAGCNACVRQRGSLLAEDIGVANLRDRSARLLAGADAVICPSADAATRLARYFPALHARIVPAETPRPAPPAPPRGLRRRRVAVIGAIGAEKGFHVLRALALDAAATGKDLEFVVVGHTVGDSALLRTGRVFITGPYQPDEAVDLIRAQQADLALLPSVVPETWCHALSEAWAAGLHAVAFDLGAQAERIRATGRGTLLPAGLPASVINRALLAARW